MRILKQKNLSEKNYCLSNFIYKWYNILKFIFSSYSYIHNLFNTFTFDYFSKKNLHLSFVRTEIKNVGAIRIVCNSFNFNSTAGNPIIRWNPAKLYHGMYQLYLFFFFGSLCDPSFTLKRINWERETPMWYSQSDCPKICEIFYTGTNV